VGPEIILKALADPMISQAAEITVIGDQRVLEDTYTRLHHHSSGVLADPAAIRMVNCQTGVEAGLSLGEGNARTGSASFHYLETAIQATLAGRFAGIVTAPIAKFTWEQAGHSYPGQTEVLAHFSQSRHYGMLFVARSPFTGWPLRVLLATTHIPLRQVPQELSPQLIQTKLDLLTQTLQQDFGLSAATIAVAGLNPHSGEAGQLGSEEVEWLSPLLRSYTRAKIVGPIAADTLWVQPAIAWHGTERFAEPMPMGIKADAYLALYHDQGLIPVKILAFERAVNTTIGLPFVRTSPDHGTAFDIAAQGIANAKSLKEAILLAAELARVRARQTILRGGS
jgi:4-hydroxythreonine-4-phosphate dehydrogenase